MGIGEALGVAVGGVVRQDDRRTGLDGLAAQLDVLQRRPHERLGDAQIPQQLLHGPVGERGIGAQRGQLRRVAQQGEGAQRQHVRGGVEPRRQQDQGDTPQLLVGQVAVGEVTEHVVGGVRALGGHQLREVVLGRGVGRYLVLVACLPAEERVDLLLEGAPVLVRHPQQLTDHDGGDGLGERGHQVRRRPGLLHGVQVVGGDLLDALGEQSHPPYGELAHQRFPIAPVLWLVHEQELAGRRRRDLHAGDVDGRVEHELLARAEPRVGQDRPDQVVSGDQPAGFSAGEGVAADRAVLAGLDQLLGRVKGTAGLTRGRQRCDGVFHGHSPHRPRFQSNCPVTPIAGRTALVSVVTSCPATTTFPASGVSSVVNTFTVVA